MRNRNRLILFALLLAATSAVVVSWIMNVPTVPAPKPASSDVFVIDESIISDGGVGLAFEYTGEIRDPASLDDLRKAILERGPVGLAALEAELAGLQQVNAPQNRIAEQYYKIGTLLIYLGRFDEAAGAIEKVLAIGEADTMPPSSKAKLILLLGVIALRQGEVANCIQCVGPSSCIFPIARDAVHQHKAGSREAIKHFAKYLESVPGDLRVRWILNVAYMTLGEYPDKVPPRYVLPLDTFQSVVDVGRFQNVAPLVGLTSRGPNQAGGSVFDDFTGDGLPDLFTTSLDVDRGASLFVNRGDGTFVERSEEAGLGDQIYALNVARADFDNDGKLDVLLLRGGWERPMRMSLLRNIGNGTFEDVTLASGLGEPIASESACWGDYDNDGLVDLFVCGEYAPESRSVKSIPPDARNHCRLYHNEGHGKFVDVAAAAGVAGELYTKGSAWGDYDGDGRLDLFVSNFYGPCRLYHNEQDGTFRDVAPELGVTGPSQGFACWFWDYDNDGRLDLYVNDYTTTLAEFVAIASKTAHQPSSRPRLYRNVGAAGFRDVTSEVGLDRAVMPMGCNFGDIDNDGFLDIYLGVGRMALESLVPNLMLRNSAGRRFEDMTMSSGTGNLQKGHGISFADWNCDGDLDMFLEAGGGTPGDRAHNALFQNPGHGRHWLKVKLVGTQSNRAAMGARIQAAVRGADGTSRSIYRTVGNNSSFGGNSLVESIGLADASRVAELVISWPASGTTQTFRDIAADEAIEITEGADSIRVLPHRRIPVPTWKAPSGTVPSQPVGD